MKTRILILILSIVIANKAKTQCDINYEEILKENCEGEYLMHKQIDNRHDSTFSLVLSPDQRYALYILNANNKLPEFELIDPGKSNLSSMISFSGKKDKYKLYTLMVNKPGSLNFAFRFNTSEDACALSAIYYLGTDKYKPGFYETFEEFKANKPSVKFNYEIISNVKKYSNEELDYFQLEISRPEWKQIDKMYGFSDGQKFYINFQSLDVRGGTEYVELQDFGRYGYYAYIAYLITSTGNVTITTPYLEQKLVDMKTGQKTDLSVKSLRSLIADDKELSARFEAEKKKSKKLKDYLMEYCERNK
ncbi:MAG: hypothetical protein JXA77_18490 [Bacteroidales bacterium]|nr:hypothetical protein [Bacteroidales bacterium]MBN2818175.1 hypothetical protein [Bacteroidales bacterium]